MTNEEALKFTDKMRLTYGTDKEAKANIDFILTVRAALEKQISKKPTENCECAVCGIDLVLNDTLHDGQRINYCPMCGQRIRWENDNGTAT